MTNADASAPPGGGAAANGCTALELFDTHGLAAFASVCRISVGDRTVAMDVLRATFAQLDSDLSRAGSSSDTKAPPAVDRHAIVLAAHRIYLDDRRSDDDWVDPDVDPTHEAPPWATVRWGPGIERLRELAVRDRIVLNLRLIEGVEVDVVADLIGCPPDEVERIVARCDRTIRDGPEAEPVVTLLRRAELWLGDDERDAVRHMLGAPVEDSADPPTRVGDRSRRSGRLRWPAVVGVALVALVGWGGVTWVQSLPENDDAQPVDTIAAEPDTSTTTTLLVAPAGQRNGIVTQLDVTPVEGATGEPDVFVMASGLDDPEVVVADFIVRYADGKVGLSWHSPCNRPAIGVSLTATTTGAVVELTTGEFNVRSCIGMPDRWTAVIRPSRPLPEGDIRPIGPGGTVPPEWDGLVEAGGPGGSADELSDDALYGSALVDDANQPWVFGLGCSSRSARYLSPVGAIFEIRRADSIDPNSYSSSDAIVCTDLASRQVLTGPLGVTFPNAPAEPGAEPRDCAGPAGSLIDVPAARPFTTRSYDGAWSTWDGCLVRSDVIFSESSFETCDGHDVRTITFAQPLGETIMEAASTVSYLRDPDGVVGAVQDPFRAYDVPSSDVHDTGLRFGDQQLWVSADTDLAIYIRVGRKIERWPRLEGEVTCTPPPAAG